MTVFILYVVLTLLLVVAVIEFIIIRGFVMNDGDIEKDVRHLTGREIEELRRKVSLAGMTAVSTETVFSLIMTIKDTHLGTYVDEDPYIPADPYEDIDERSV
jgi:hypothetical protein